MAIPMDDACEKLANLSYHLPETKSDLIYSFGSFLASRLERCTFEPEGFFMAYFLAINELETGIDSHTGKRLDHVLVGYPPFVYLFLAKSMRDVARTVFPMEFADQVVALEADFKKKQTAKKA